MGMRKWLLSLALGVAAASAQAQVPAADPVGLRGDIGGLWYNPAQNGQGLQLDVLDRGQAALTWYTFNLEGAPLWLTGLGRIEGDRIRATMFLSSGGRFALLPGTLPTPQQLEFGELEVQFSGCNSATLAFDPVSTVVPAGSIPLQRLSSPQGVRCNSQEEFAEQRSFSFERGPQQFTPVFADLPRDDQDIYELAFAWEALPAPLQARRGIRLTGHNRSDDLAMLVKAPIRGLLPDQVYRVELELELASNVPSGCIGVGGSPGESVYLKLGAVGSEPQAVVQDEGGTPTLRLNVDFGNQSSSGSAARVVGDLANSQSCDNLDRAQWELKSVSTRGGEFRARSDAAGTLWLVAGTDSAFEGLTEVYFTALQVRLLAIAP